MNARVFSQNIENWYLTNKRDLPWRQNPQPYRVWLAEIVFQQTQIAQGLAYYQRLLNAFPTLQSLANAEQDEVLKLWEGLGYYSRARNLHRAAQILNEAGHFPISAAEWLKLPGVGPYTAAAIASVCYGECIACVDGNVMRVIARTHFISDDIRKSSVVKQIQSLVNELVTHADDPGNFNQGLMELGATICKPKSPQCNRCPLQNQCTFYHSDALPGSVPFKSKPQKRKERHLHFFYASQSKDVFLHKRKEDDIWGGLYVLPLMESTDKEWPDNNRGYKLIKKNTHLLTHQKIHYYIWDVVSWSDSPVALDNFSRFIKEDQLPALPRPLKQFLEEQFV